jgi:hypothetical protein
MSRPLAYLAGLLSRFYVPQLIPPLKSIDVVECGLHPKLEGRGQLNLECGGT